MDRDTAILGAGAAAYVATVALRTESERPKATPMQVEKVSASALSVLRGPMSAECGGRWPADIFPAALDTRGKRLTTLAAAQRDLMRDAVERKQGAGAWTDPKPNQTAVVCGREWAQRWVSAWWAMAQTEPVLMQAARPGQLSPLQTFERAGAWDSLVSLFSPLYAADTAVNVATETIEEANRLIYEGNVTRLPAGTDLTSLGADIVALRAVLADNALAYDGDRARADGEGAWLSIGNAIIDLAGELDERLIHMPNRWNEAWTEFTDTVTDPASYGEAAADLSLGAASVLGGAVGRFISGIVFSNLGGLVLLGGAGYLVYRASKGKGK
jgi:hypothetical protein